MSIFLRKSHGSLRIVSTFLVAMEVTSKIASEGLYKRTDVNFQFFEPMISRRLQLHYDLSPLWKSRSERFAVLLLAPKRVQDMLSGTPNIHCAFSYRLISIRKSPLINLIVHPLTNRQRSLSVCSITQPFRPTSYAAKQRFRSESY